MMGRDLRVVRTPGESLYRYSVLIYGLRNLIPCPLVPIFDQFRIMLKTRSIEQQSTLVFEDSLTLNNCWKSAKPPSKTNTSYSMSVAPSCNNLASVYI